MELQETGSVKMVSQSLDSGPLLASRLSVSQDEMTRARVFKVSPPLLPPTSLSRTRDTNTISVSHSRLMGSKHSSIITHIIKFNNPRLEGKLSPDGVSGRTFLSVLGDQETSP